ncbi:MAG: hypothetical protein JJE47_02570 [Acidimicrobiia bacterium]|nr:hypothetical protein [Acidimicrobiia bacterium]
MGHPEDSLGFKLIGHSNLGGNGDGMQIARNGDALYVAHFGPSRQGTSILDISDLTSPRLVDQWPAPDGGHTHKAVAADGLLLTNHEAFRGGPPARVGMAVYDTTDPLAPTEVGFWDSTGMGVHRISYTGGRYAYVSSRPTGFVERIWNIIDVSDPTNPVETGRWWWPGMADGETPDWPADEERSVHHALVHGNRAYAGFWNSGMVILDISDMTSPQTISHLNWEIGGHTHTCLPLPDRNLLVVTDEAVTNGCEDDPHMVRIVDISDETNPKVVAICPVPEGDFCDRGLRFGAHCLHENQPGSYQSQTLVFATYFNGGLRVYDIENAAEPVEIGHYLPDTPDDQPAVQINDVWVDADHTVFITDRVNGGLYILRPEDWLSKRMTAAYTEIA